MVRDAVNQIHVVVAARRLRPEEAVDVLDAPGEDGPLEDVESDADGIPRNDVTYQWMGNHPTPHPRLPNMFLFQFVSFTGYIAYQPCSMNIDLMGIFDTFISREKDLDYIFKIGRVWSCVVQAHRNLPRDIRWVAATVYNLCMDMLKPDTKAEVSLSMRKWLVHWYNTADQLFRRHGIPATSPDMDWLLAVGREHEGYDNGRPLRRRSRSRRRRRRHNRSQSTASDTTVIRNLRHRPGPQSNQRVSRSLQRSDDEVEIWIDQVSHELASEYQGIEVWVNQLVEQDQRPSTDSPQNFRLNPLAAAFTPQSSTSRSSSGPSSPPDSIFQNFEAAETETQISEMEEMVLSNRDDCPLVAEIEV